MLLGFDYLILPPVLSLILILKYSTKVMNCKHRIGFAARLAGRWSNGHFIAVVLHLGWTFIPELLFVNLYFYIFKSAAVPGWTSYEIQHSSKP